MINITFATYEMRMNSTHVKREVVMNSTYVDYEVMVNSTYVGYELMMNIAHIDYNNMTMNLLAYVTYYEVANPSAEQPCSRKGIAACNYGLLVSWVVKQQRKWCAGMGEWKPQNSNDIFVTDFSGTAIQKLFKSYSKGHQQRQPLVQKNMATESAITV